VHNFQQVFLSYFRVRSKLYLAMRNGLVSLSDGPSPGAPLLAKELFRARFQRSLRNCVRRRFSVAECFGVIWVETLEQVRLEDDEQAELYEELITWAKHHLFRELMHSRLS
jgi:hypothetical protein